MNSVNRMAGVFQDRYIDLVFEIFINSCLEGDKGTTYGEYHDFTRAFKRKLILVVVANIQMRTLKTEVEKGSMKKSGNSKIKNLTNCHKNGTTDNLGKVINKETSNLTNFKYEKQNNSDSDSDINSLFVFCFNITTNIIEDNYNKSFNNSKEHEKDNNNKSWIIDNFKLEMKMCNNKDGNVKLFNKTINKSTLPLQIHAPSFSGYKYYIMIIAFIDDYKFIEFHQRMKNTCNYNIKEVKSDNDIPFNYSTPDNPVYKMVLPKRINQTLDNSTKCVCTLYNLKFHIRYSSDSPGYHARDITSKSIINYPQDAFNSMNEKKHQNSNIENIYLKLPSNKKKNAKILHENNENYCKKIGRQSFFAILKELNCIAYKSILKGENLCSKILIGNNKKKNLKLQKIWIGLLQQALHGLKTRWKTPCEPQKPNTQDFNRTVQN
ncbi:hypothetical protein H8356DRAFT_1359399 [Neocallimastix lanati (nom. inval.)]|nr:hypothetical protein H8356DRAFT_1359399 [Neocallimastix sp. JGI-2020a]